MPEEDDEPIRDLYIAIGANFVTQTMLIYTMGFEREEVLQEAKSYATDLDFIYMLQLGDRDVTGEPHKFVTWLNDHGMPMEEARDTAKRLCDLIMKRVEKKRDSLEEEIETDESNPAPVDAPSDCQDPGKTDYAGAGGPTAEEQPDDQERTRSVGQS